MFKQERKVWSASLYWCNRCPFPQRDLHTKSLGRWNYSCHNNSTHLSVQSIFPLDIHTPVCLFDMLMCNVTQNEHHTQNIRLQIITNHLASSHLFRIFHSHTSIVKRIETKNSLLGHSLLMELYETKDIVEILQ